MRIKVNESKILIILIIIYLINSSIISLFIINKRLENKETEEKDYEQNTKDINMKNNRINGRIKEKILFKSASRNIREYGLYLFIIISIILIFIKILKINCEKNEQ